MLGDNLNESQLSVEELIKENRSLKRQVRNLESVLQRNIAMLAARTTVNSMLESEQMKIERNMNLLLENSADIILLFDKDGRFTYYTNTFLKVTGLTGSDCVSGIQFFEIFSQLVSQEWIDHIHANMVLAAEQRNTINLNSSVDLSGGGNPQEYDIQITPMLNKNGQLEAFMILLHDITDIMRSKRQSESANKAKSVFLSIMSHEIRTPMNAVLGITEMLLQNETLTQSVREALCKIYASGDLLLGIINDILDLSKIEAGKLELNIDKYEIASVISDTAQLNMMRIGSKQIEFELSLDENLPANLMGDELRVKEILNNILSNAFKYTNEGTVKLSISYEKSDSDDCVILILRVSDTGQGMTKEQIESLFDEYSRFNMESNRTTEGTGLGMSITRNLTRLMGGEISIESEPGKGSTFTVRLPQKKVDDAVLGKELVSNLHRFRTSSNSRMKMTQIVREPMPYGCVLIVDDVETNIYVAKGLMFPYGLKIDSADSGFEAIRKIKNGNLYDIVFMDHMMPKMDGVEATKTIRSMGYTRPIVALTANAVAGQAEVFLKNGFDDYISKPIDVRQLNALLNKLVRDKHLPEIIEAARKGIVADIKQTTDNAQQAIDPQLAEICARDALKSIKALDAICEKRGVYSNEDIRRYSVHVHGMKSVLANIGRAELSNIALKLETAANNGNIEVIVSETPAFISALRALVDELTPKEEKTCAASTDKDKAFLLEKLLVIKQACEEFDISAADAAIKELKEKSWSQQTKELLNVIAEHLLYSDFDDITRVVNKYMESE